jgi:hypothetical protein
MKIYKNLDISDLEDEIWKVIKDFPDYFVSNLGRIKSFKQNKINGKILHQQLNKNNGYLKVELCKNGKSCTKEVHKLVYENFKEKLNKKFSIHHIDHDCLNNNINNFESKLKSEHYSLHSKESKGFSGRKHLNESKIKISEKIKGKFSGENHPSHKLLNKDICDIRKSLELKLYTPKQLSWMFDVSVSTIYDIKNKKSWLY